MALIQAYEDQYMPPAPLCYSRISHQHPPLTSVMFHLRLLSAHRYQTLIKDVNAKIDRLKNLSSSAATDSEAWAGTAAAVQRDVEDAEEVLGKFTMEARRCIHCARLQLQRC